MLICANRNLWPGQKLYYKNSGSEKVADFTSRFQATMHFQGYALDG